jgi:hypothetical protein
MCLATAPKQLNFLCPVDDSSADGCDASYDPVDGPLGKVCSDDDVMMGNDSMGDTSSDVSESPLSDTPPQARLAFREDLDEAEQVARAFRDRQNARAAVHLADWKTTVASKKDHAIFLKMLVVEAHRQNPRAVNRQEVTRMFDVVRAAVDSSPQDPYIQLIGRMSSARMFSVPPNTGVKLRKQSE